MSSNQVGTHKFEGILDYIAKFCLNKQTNRWFYQCVS